MSIEALYREARALDRDDTLARFRDAFTLPVNAEGQELVYLCGHSLGLAPRSARSLVEEELTRWEQLGVRGHHEGPRPWIDFAEALQPGLARLAGASTDEVVAMNGLTVNLQLLMASFYRPEGRRRCIVIESGAFPSDRHAVVSQLLWHGLDPQEALIELEPGDASGVIEESALEQLLASRGSEVALVLWPGVQYLSGQAFDLARIAAASRRAGAACGFDLAHAIGNLPLALHDDGADFAVWCSYKYLNAGPGAIAGAFVHARHARTTLPRLAGWWGHDPATRFAMEPAFVPAKGAAGWQLSNPPILSAAPLIASLAIFDEAGIGPLRAKSLALNAFLWREVGARFGARLQRITPEAPERQGCQLSLRLRAGRDTGRSVFDTLTQLGIVCDWREPDVLRFAPVPLYNRFNDIARLVDALDRTLNRP
ncbi:MAG: kynureninase [Pseudomonadota bacterium]